MPKTVTDEPDNRPTSSVYMAVVAARVPADILAAAVLTPAAPKVALYDLPARLDPSKICFRCMEEAGTEFCCGGITVPEIRRDEDLHQAIAETPFPWFGAR